MAKREDFESRWGNPIADDYQYCLVPGYILRHYHECVSENDVADKKGTILIRRGQVVGLGMLEAMFIIHVMAFKYDNGKGKAKPSLKTIADYAGVSVDAIRRLKRTLEACGLMTIQSIPGKTDIYEFRGLHDQCVRLEQGQSPLEGVTVIPMLKSVGKLRGWARAKTTGSKNATTSKSATTSGSKNATSSGSKSATRRIRRKELEEKKEKPSAPDGARSPKVREPDPLFDAVKEYVFGIKEGSAEGGRIGQISNWLKGKYAGPKGREVGFISRPAEPEHVKRFVSHWKAHNGPEVSVPRDITKFTEHWRAWAQSAITSNGKSAIGQRVYDAKSNITREWDGARWVEHEGNVA